MKKLCWFTFFMILAASCLDDPDCYQLHNDVLGVTFRVIGTGQGDSTTLKNFNAAGETATLVSLNYKLNYFKELDALLFDGPEEDHHLEFGYKVKNQFVSEDCGSRFVLSDLHILAHDFDSARVVNSSPSKTGGANIDLYRCPETDTLTINFNQLYAASDGVFVTNKSSKFISHHFDPITADSTTFRFRGRVATINLPVRLGKNQTKYFFKVGEIQDSLIVRYDLTTTTRYNACGVQTFVSDLTFTSNSFDSISYALNSNDEPQRTLVDPHVPNLRVFDCPKMNQLQVNFKSGAGAAQNILIKGVTSEHFTGKFLKDPITTNSLTLPVDTESNGSIFYIQYENRTDTLNVQYTRTPIQLFKACGSQMVIMGLQGTIEPNINTLKITGTALKFPTVPNVEITIN